MSSVQIQINKILQEVMALPEDWHGAGTVVDAALEALVRHCSDLNIKHSIETGAGRTTLLFSHLSPNHKVFAKDNGNGSITKVQQSPLFNSECVEFIEGANQLTLPKYQFDCQFQVALIDGPHGYPFPDMEYYYIYPHLDTGAILIVDDIQIPTIYNMFKFIEADEMFSLIEIVGNTAFFRRTDVATFNPLGDGWWLQNYNKGKEATSPGKLSSLLSMAERDADVGTKNLPMIEFPKSVRWLARLAGRLVLYFTLVVTVPQRRFNRSILQILRRLLDDVSELNQKLSGRADQISQIESSSNDPRLNIERKAKG